jgi:hypothetical protein
MALPEREIECHNLRDQKELVTIAMQGFRLCFKEALGEHKDTELDGCLRIEANKPSVPPNYPRLLDIASEMTKWLRALR